MFSLVPPTAQAVAAVEPELRELLCVLLDADLSFDLSSTTYPHYVGGAVAATLQEVCQRWFYICNGCFVDDPLAVHVMIFTLID